MGQFYVVYAWQQNVDFKNIDKPLINFVPLQYFNGKPQLNSRYPHEGIKLFRTAALFARELISGMHKTGRFSNEQFTLNTLIKTLWAW